MMRNASPAAALLALLVTIAPAFADKPKEKLTYADDVQPILRRHCFRCHAGENEEGGLKLQRRDDVVAAEADSGESIVVPHDSASSLLIKRMINEDLGDVMPLDGEPLKQRELDLIRRWIDQGATWGETSSNEEHWAYQPVKRPTLPGSSQHESSDAPGGRTNETPIDQFLLRRLKQRGLDFAAELDRPRLLRRVSLALTGLPPSPEQVRQFVEDKSDDAYENIVDKLLESPRYGERWAIPWLDLARYADSNGFQADQIRDNWAYRDWVIRAFNDDMPFDQFVIDQLAGDLRPNATIEQKVATGFHRMTTCNVEAGVHPEANRVNQVVDRVNTTATVFLGTTLECAQCHDHKYDPFTQQDYYRLFAYFNSTPLEVENTAGVTWDFYGPKMDLPLPDQKRERRSLLENKLQERKQERAVAATDTETEFQTWLSGLRETGDADWKPEVPVAFESTGDETYEIQSDGAVLLSGSVPDTVDHIFTLSPAGGPITAIRLDVLTDDSIPGKGPGRGDAKRTNIILSEITCETIHSDGSTESIELVDAMADFSQKNWDVANAIDGKRKTGWAISPQFGKPHWASFVLATPLTNKSDETKLRITLSQLFGRGRVIGKPRISLYRGDAEYLNIESKYRALAQKKKLNKGQQEQLRAEFEKHNPRLRRLDVEITRLEKQLSEVAPDTTLVMQELAAPRETFVMIRGDYENLAAKVKAGTPASLPQPSQNIQSGNRMELAKWLTSRDNPLLSRVTVNRWWGQFFGTGLVSSPEDFGTQGEAPSHPALLDWLAFELMDNGWSMKRIHKEIVMSRAFRQASLITSEKADADPENRLLSRGPRFRLEAEVLRDNALAISGLLSSKMYGKPIMPFQPENIWRSVGRNQPKWIAAENEDRFRRGVYVVWKRAAPYPSFINFDAPNRGSCTVDRGRSNTPLQALTLLNDPAYAEMALALADRILNDAPSTDDQECIAYGMKLAVARSPSQLERDILNQLLQAERETLRDNPKLIEQRTTVPFEGMQPSSTDKQELAAWFAVANALLNLDETMNQ